MTTSSHPVPRIFISHSHSDDEFGIKLTQDLRRVLGDDTMVWYDVEGGLYAGEDWWKKIVEELTARNVFIVILSSDAVKSKWVDNEITIAWKQKNSTGKHIIPVLYSQCKIREDLDTLHIVSFLPPKTYEAAFNELLRAIGISTDAETRREVSEPNDPRAVLVRQMSPQIEQAFAEEDWTDVIRKVEHLIKHATGAVPSTIYHKHGLAFLKEGQTQRASEAFESALALVSNREQRLKILSDYAALLTSQGHWTEVLNLSKEALRLAPNESHWQMIQQMVLKLELNTTKQADTAPLPPGVLQEGSNITHPDPPTPQVESPPPPVGTTPHTYRNHTEVYAVAWSPDSRYIAAAGNRRVCVWDVRTQKLISTYDKHTDLIRAVAWERDGTRIASAGDDKTVHVWDPVSGQQVSVYGRHTHWVNAIAWSPDGSYIASASKDSTVHIWDPVSGHQVFVFSHHSDRANTVAWSPDGKRVVSGSSNKLVRVWDTSTRKEVLYRGHTGSVTAVLWSPDKRNIASASYDGTIQIWDALTGIHVSTYGEHHNPVLAIAFSPRGNSIASAGKKSVHVWDVKTQKLIYTYDKHTNLIRTVAWSGDGMHIASAGDDKTVQIWSFDQSHSKNEDFL